jgi:hypothetical protein
MLYKWLTWKKQLNNIINKTYRAFWMCISMDEKTWGLKSKVVHCVYVEAVRPLVPMPPEYGGPELNKRQPRLN